MKSKLLLGIMIVGMLVVSGCSNDSKNISVGSYIAYKPNITSCTVLKEYSGAEEDQTYNPSSVTSWKVFKNNDGQLDIISSESIGDLTLQGSTGYANYVYVLNSLCSQYANEYADGAVSIGSTKNWIKEPANATNTDIANSIGIIDTNAYPIRHAITYCLVDKYPYEDTHYLTTMPLEDNGYLEKSLRHGNDYVWIASRSLDVRNSLSNFYVKRLYSDGRISGDFLCHSYLSGKDSLFSHSYGVRPVVSLKEGIKITGGRGTKNNPYTISM